MAPGAATRRERLVHVGELLVDFRVLEVTIQTQRALITDEQMLVLRLMRDVAGQAVTLGDRLVLELYLLLFVALVARLTNRVGAKKVIIPSSVWVVTTHTLGCGERLVRDRQRFPWWMAERTEELRWPRGLELVIRRFPVGLVACIA